jgi:hypothetical protein
MDRVLKFYFDDHAKAGMFPPEMESLEGAMPFPDRALMNRWRNWRSLIIDIDGIAQLSGGLDEIIVWPDGLHSPYDYKTRGAAPVDGKSEEYYGAQLDIYHLLIEVGCKLKCNGRAFLGYYWPDGVEQSGVFKFKTSVVELESDPARAVKLVHDAVDCLSQPEPPDRAPLCEYCAYTNARGEVEVSIQAPIAAA